MKLTVNQAGSVNPLVISNVILAVLTIAFGSFMIWAYTNYRDQKDNTDQKIAVAVTAAKKDQVKADEKDFLEREKAPYVTYTGPDDLGQVTFNYPKTWSAYTHRSSPDGLEVYLHPKIVPTVQQGQQFATELKVINRSVEQTLRTYDALVKKGDLKSTPVVINGFNGTRLDGQFNNGIRGSTVLFKLRDKTLSLAAGAETFRSDFDNIILASLDFNP